MLETHFEQKGNSGTNWLNLKDPPPLEPGQAHIFLLNLRSDIEGFDPSQYLDDEEKARARRFIFDADRHRFMITHSQVRLILGALLNIHPANLVFIKNPHGKPSLVGSRLKFNLSHSRDLGLLAVILDQEIGVDIEVIRPEVDRDSLASRFFAPQEVHALSNLPESERLEGFFNCWSRKEAYIKARGLGLKIPLRKFTVSVAPGQPAAVISPDPGASPTWDMAALTPHPGYCGALVVEGRLRGISCWRWTFPT